MQNFKQPSGFFAKSTRAPHGKEEGLMAFTSKNSLTYCFTLRFFMEYSSIVSSILVQCLIPAESSAYLPASCSVVPFFISTQEIHSGTYISSYLVGHNTDELHQANGVLHFPKNPSSLYKISLRKRTGLMDIFYYPLYFMVLPQHTMPGGLQFTIILLRSSF